MSSIAIRGKNKGAAGLVTTTTLGTNEALDVNIAGGSDLNINTTSIDTSGYSGKATGGNGDFTTAYTSAITITLSDLPSDVTAFLADDIASVVQVGTAGGVTATYDRDDVVMTMTGNVLTVTGATFAASDTFIVYTNVARPSGGSGGATADAEYKSPTDFQAAYTSSTTVTLSALPISITDDSQIAYVKVVPASGDTAVYVNGSNGVTMRESAGVLTISGAGTPFVTADAYEIGINAQKKAYDAGLDNDKVNVQNPDWEHYTAPVQLVTASDIVATTTVYKDQGGEIDMTGYDTLGLFVKFTVNDSATNTIKILAKYESGGTDEFILETTADYIKTLGDANINIYYEFETNGTIPFLQVQSTATTVGATEGTLEINYTKK